MPLSRRRLLGLGLTVPIVALVDHVVVARDVVTRGVAPHIRPIPSGTSGMRCATCGAADHTMLQDRCPARRRVR